MAVEIKYHIPDEMTPRGIYYATITASYQNAKIERNIVFARYSSEHSFKRFFKEFPLSQLGLREKSNSKQVLNVKLTIINYLSDVNIDTYNRWLEEQKNKTA